VAAVRRGRGIKPHADDLVADGFAHRFKMAWTSSFLRGGIHIGSIYLKDSVGLDSENMLTLREVAIAVKKVKGPWIIGGDWNMAPDVLLSSNWPRLIGGVICAGDSPTCNGSNYDFFIVSEHLAPSIVGVLRITDGGLSPHWPTRLLLKGDGRRHMTRQIVKPRRIPAILPHGPLPEPAPLRSEWPRSVDLGTIEAAANKWMEAAYSEWSSLTGEVCKHSVPSFRWRPAVGGKADPLCWVVQSFCVLEVYGEAD